MVWATGLAGLHDVSHDLGRELGGGVKGQAALFTCEARDLPQLFIDSLHIVRSATAALTASATPVVVTTTGLPGNPAFTFGQDVAGIGIDKDARLDCGPEGFAAAALGAATTVVCPAYVGVIWRVNCLYHLGT